MSEVLKQARVFAHQHDDVPAFHAAYIVLSIVAAALFSLGYFVILIVIHMALDWVKYRDVHAYSVEMTVRAIFIESITDIALLFVAITFGVYLHHTFAVVALSGFVRSSFAVAEAAAKLLPKITIFQHIAVTLLNLHTHLHVPVPDIKQRLSRAHAWSLYTIFVCFLLLIAAVFLYMANGLSILDVLKEELSLSM